MRITKYKSKKLQKLTIEAIEELKKSSQVYDDSIIYYYLCKAHNLRKIKSLHNTKKRPVHAIKKLFSGATSTQFFTSIAHANRVTGVPTSAISRASQKKDGGIASGYLWKETLTK